MQVFDWFERNAPGRRQEKAHISDGPADERERAKECFEQYAKDLGGIVLFAQSAKYRINLPKPSRKTCLALGGNWGYSKGQGWRSFARIEVRNYLYKTPHSKAVP